MKTTLTACVTVLPLLIVPSATQAWPGIRVALQATRIGSAQNEDPPAEVIQRGLTMLAEGQSFSTYDLWAIATAVESPEYTVVAGTDGWVFQGGDLTKIGADFGQYCEIGQPVGPGVYWNLSQFEVQLTNDEDSSTLLKVPANGLLSIGLPSDLHRAIAIGDTDDPKIVCWDNFSACCNPNGRPPTMRCIADNKDNELDACEGGGKGARSCDMGGLVECRENYYACCNPSDTPPTFKCHPRTEQHWCEWGGPGTASCDLAK